MLAYLRIKNLAIADDVSIELKNGFTVLTGETGAGKSIIVDAIGLLSGTRAYRELIRTGEERAVVEGIFEELPDETRQILKENHIDFNTSLNVKRVILKNGKNRVFLNDQPSTLALLETIGKSLVEIHSQNDQILLLNAENHLTYLDIYGNHHDLLGEVKSKAEKLKKEQAELKKLSIDEREKNQRIDMLKFQIKEIKDIGLKENEEKELEEKKIFLKNIEKIKEAIENANTVLNSQPGLYHYLKTLFQSIETLSKYNNNLKNYIPLFEDFIQNLKELDLEIGSIAFNLETEGSSLDEIEHRLYQIEKLKKKYGETYREIIQFLKNAEKELAMLEEIDLQIKEQKHKVITAARDYIESAKKLSKKRERTAKNFEKQLEKELKQLAMKNVKIEFRINNHLFSKKEEELLTLTPSPSGMDYGELYFSPNIGEEPRPLSKIASGGELSRVMLAIKVLTNDNLSKLTVFDEIDTGIGGETAFYIGEKLKSIAEHRQVLCVTHLPQIASKADNHFVVKKIVFEDRTKTMVELLNREQRIKEIARMLGGERLTKASLKHAEELLGG